MHRMRIPSRCRPLFEVDDEEEPLISLPVDFDDVVDINASLTASERRRSKEPGAVDDFKSPFI